jgi:hypothetical protein
MGKFERGHLGDTGIDGRIIQEWVLKKLILRSWPG